MALNEMPRTVSTLQPFEFMPSFDPLSVGIGLLRYRWSMVPTKLERLSFKLTWWMCLFGQAV